MKRIVLATFGSLGDLHPSIALALELQKRGHKAVIATHAFFQSNVESEGLGFYAVRPDIAQLGDGAEITKRAMDPVNGPEYIIRELFLAHFKSSYDDLIEAASSADLLVSHPVTFQAPLVGEKLGIPWAATALAPTSFFSCYDPPVLAGAPWLSKLHPLGPGFYRLLFRLISRKLDCWVAPVYALRSELGLADSGLNPILAGQFSPHLNLALFSALLALPQKDWPANTVQTGFPFYDKHTKPLAPSIKDFMNEGDPPFVFTLGSSAVQSAGDFYHDSAAAAKSLGRRALFLAGKNADAFQTERDSRIMAVDYAPHSQVFPRAAAIVHQGGVGTTAQALRAGRPTLVVPFGVDQPDNANRVTRLGVARTVSQPKYNGKSAETELRELLNNPVYALRSAEVGENIRAERGAEAAVDALEKLLD